MHKPIAIVKYGSLLTLLALGGCCQRQAVTVARVGKTAITAPQLAHWTAVLRAGHFHSPGDAARLHVAALKLLLEATWIEGQAREDHVALDQRDATRTLALLDCARLRRLTPIVVPWETELGKFLNSPAATRSDEQRLIRIGLLHRELERRGLARAERAVAATQVRRYFLSHCQRFAVPEQRDVAIVESYSRRDMVNAKRELQRGLSLKLVARRFSTDPVSPNGLKRDVVQGEGARALSRAIFSARPHVVVGPLRVAMYYVFEVLAVRRRRLLSLYAAAASVRARLAAGAPRRVLEASFYRKWRLRTDCQGRDTLGACRLALAGT